jgi:type II secretory pathway component PulC
MLGEYVAEVTSDMFNTGKHEVVFDASDLGQGTYFIKMNTEVFTSTNSMNVVK